LASAASLSQLSQGDIQRLLFASTTPSAHGATTLMANVAQEPLLAHTPHFWSR
jgi:hypothetical protein